MITDPWTGVAPGTVVDSAIIELARSGQLITEAFDERCVKQACYELRASSTFFETSSPTENKRRVVGADGYVLRPHSYVTAIVQERIELPPDVLARILTKGQLFSVGILPVCTYADPGFQGRLGITLYNSSHRYIVLRPGQPIAKIEFSRLPVNVVRPYSGQHGFETEIWPIPVHLYAEPASLEERGIKRSDIGEIERSYGPVVANLEARLRFYETKVWILIGITVIAFALLFAVGGTIGWFWSIVLGVATNLLTNLIVYISGSPRL